MADAGNHLTMLTAAVAIVDAAVTGNVYPRQMLRHDMGEFVSQFVVANVVNAWTVSRSSTTEKRLTNVTTERTITFKIRGVRSASGNSEDDFQADVELICDAFRADYDLNGTAEFTGLVQVTTVDHRVFGSVFCHYAEMTLTATERLAGN